MRSRIPGTVALLALVGCPGEPPGGDVAASLRAASVAMAEGEDEEALRLYEALLESGDALPRTDRLDALLGSVRCLARSGRLRLAVERAAREIDAPARAGVADGRLCRTALELGWTALHEGSLSPDEFDALKARVLPRVPSAVRRRLEDRYPDARAARERGRLLTDGLVLLTTRSPCGDPSCGGTLVIRPTDLGRRALTDRLIARLGSGCIVSPEGLDALREVIEEHPTELFETETADRFAAACLASVRAGSHPSLGRTEVLAARGEVFGP